MADKTEEGFAVTKRNDYPNEAEMLDIWRRADALGIEAGKQCKVTPWFSCGDTEGACGFAWVEVRPRNSKFAKFARAHLNGYDSAYTRSIHLSCPHFNQSLDRKAAWANAAASVLMACGIEAMAVSRID